MKTSWIVGGVIVILLLLFGIQGCSSYNGMVTLDEAVNQAWGNVENQYQRRADLIPNLVATVKGYSEHESSTLEAVTNARAGLTQAYNNATDVTAEQATAPTDEASLRQFQQAQSQLKGALDIYVNAVKEAYPDLKANQNFLDLQTQLEGTENRVSTERTRYNEAVKEYNVKIRRFPASIFAGVFGFAQRPMFQAEEGAQKAPKVEF
ncbi:MAG: LemA family protein [Bacteroidales bacterium]|nr:LemA family protein [Bacteroidales bacterium]